MLAMTLEGSSPGMGSEETRRPRPRQPEIRVAGLGTQRRWRERTVAPAAGTRALCVGLSSASCARVDTSPIHVVCAVIEDGQGRVLIAQRPAHKHLALQWEFPGGKVEAGESPERALLREIAEELGCAITVQRALPRFVHDYGAVVIEMIPFVCRLAAGSPAPQPHEHVALRWATLAELSQVALAAADLPVVASYRG